MERGGGGSTGNLDLFVGGKHLTAKKKRPKQAELFNRRRRSRDAGQGKKNKAAQGRAGGTAAGPPAGVGGEAAAFFDQAGPDGGAEFGPEVNLQLASEPEPEPEQQILDDEQMEGGETTPREWGDGDDLLPSGMGGGSSDDEWMGGAPPQSLAEAKRVEQAAKLETFHAAVETSFRQLVAEDIPWLPMESLTLGKEISRGAFGVVKDAVAEIEGEEVEVAVKTLPARQRGHRSTLKDFENEVRMGWHASWKTRTGKRTSRVLRMFGIAYNLTKNGKRAQLRIVMERVTCDGDMHDEIHAEEHWTCLRDNGVDTGASVRNQYVTVDGHDVWAYVMPVQLKLRLALDLARSLRELDHAEVVHRDIKPSNMLLHVGDAESEEGLLLKLMDFGEAAAADVCASRNEVAGTPGYMAIEVEQKGTADALSDVFSAGVTLLELWVGSIGPTFDEYEGVDEVGPEGVRAMRREMNDVLAKVEKAEPEIGALLRRCCADERSRRPSTKQLVHSFKRLNGLRPGASKAKRRWKKTGLAIAAAHRMSKG